MITLKNVLNDVESFCNQHDVIQEFNNGDFTDYQSNDHKYPLVWLSPTASNTQSGQNTYRFNLAVMSIVYNNQDKMKVLSDCQILLAEILSYFNADNDTLRYFMKTTGSFSPFYDSIDNSTGWQGDVEIVVPFSYDYNKIRF
jgi:hypothetical protein